MRKVVHCFEDFRLNRQLTMFYTELVTGGESIMLSQEVNDPILSQLFLV